MSLRSSNTARVLLFAALLTGGLHAASRRRPAGTPPPAPPLPSSAAASPLARPATLAAGRCADLAARYRAERATGAACQGHEECQVQRRGGLYTGLDGCFLASHRGPAGAADKLAEEWLGGGCASSFDLCPPIEPRALCEEGACVVGPPEGIPDSWRRVDVEEAISVFVPPGMIEEKFHAPCSSGPRVRLLATPGLRLRVEMGQEAGYQVMDDQEPAADRVLSRVAGSVGLHPATWISLRRARVSSRELAPDGTWPSYEGLRLLVIEGVEARPMPWAFRANPSPSAAVLVLEGERASTPLGTQILASALVW